MIRAVNWIAGLFIPLIYGVSRFAMKRSHEKGCDCQCCIPASERQCTVCSTPKILFVNPNSPHTALCRRCLLVTMKANVATVEVQ